MKYIFTILFLTFLLLPTSSVYSARLVPGTVPSSTPLQPMPEGSGVNYSGNIDYHSDNQPVTSQEQQGEAPKEEAAVSKQAFEESTFSVGGLSAGAKIFLAIILVVLGGFVVLKAYRKNAK